MERSTFEELQRRNNKAHRRATIIHAALTIPPVAIATALYVYAILTSYGA